ncbi:tellurium resistance protein TerZ [Arthrobacter sp. NicSoilB11]|nr:TerD family protein [Arthrobacter sp. NicSoilB11]BCW74728.1 tellurium resistance protein TerZ [Arthrobacter sp. NicSoilB11]
MGLSLTKGQSLSLTKRNGESLTKIRLGLGWDSAVPAKRGFFGGTKTVEIDLDASAILFDANKQPLDLVFFNNLKSKDGSIKHTGDNLTGAGDGDDESITVDLSAVSPAAAHIVFVITSYSQQTFDMVENAFCRVIDESVAAAPEVAKYQLTESGRHTAMIMAKLSRDVGGWRFQAIGAPANGKTAHDVLQPAAAAL